MMVWEGLILTLCIGTCLRIVFYQRNGSIYKWHYSFLAYVLVLSISFLGLILLNTQIVMHPIIELFIIWLAVGAFSCRGNVAQMVNFSGRRLV
jgi:hypothetical protein